MIADPKRALFDAFGLGRGSIAQVAGVRAILASFRALARGHFPKRPRGDVRLMPGIFLCEQDHVHWSFRARHSADRPPVSTLLSESVKLVAGST